MFVPELPRILLAFPPGESVLMDLTEKANGDECSCDTLDGDFVAKTFLRRERKGFDFRVLA